MMIILTEGETGQDRAGQDRTVQDMTGQQIKCLEALLRDRALKALNPVIEDVLKVDNVRDIFTLDSCQLPL